MQGVMFALGTILLLATSALAQSATTQFYDRAGSSRGSAVTSGNTTRFYDRAGFAKGAAVTSGETTRCYDRASHSLGWSRTQGDVTTYYDPAGHVISAGRNHPLLRADSAQRGLCSSLSFRPPPKGRIREKKLASWPGAQLSSVGCLSHLTVFGPVSLIYDGCCFGITSVKTG